MIFLIASFFTLSGSYNNKGYSFVKGMGIYEATNESFDSISKKTLLLEDARVKIPIGKYMWLVFDIVNVKNHSTVTIKGLEDYSIKEIHSLSHLGSKKNSSLTLDVKGVPKVRVFIKVLNKNIDETVSIIAQSGFSTTDILVIEIFLIIAFVISLFLFSQTPGVLLGVLVFVYSLYFSLKYLSNTTYALIPLLSSLVMVISNTASVYFVRAIFKEVEVKVIDDFMTLLLYAGWASLFLSPFLDIFRFCYFIKTILFIITTYYAISFVKTNNKIKYYLLASIYSFATIFRIFHLFKIFGFISFQTNIPYRILVRVAHCLPLLFIAILVCIKFGKSQKLERAINLNAEFVFKVLKETSNLKDAITSFIVSSSKYLNFNSANIFLNSEDNKICLYSSIPGASVASSEQLHKILSLISLDEEYICSNIADDRVLKYSSAIHLYSSFMMFPLKLNGKRLGNIVLLNVAPNAFSERDVILAREIAYKASVILNIYRQIELISIYNKKLQIEETIRMFQKNASHDIKSPLRGIKTILQIIMDKYKEDTFLYPLLEHIESAADSAMDQVKESISLAIEEKSKFKVDALMDELSDLKKLAELSDINVLENNQVNRELYGPVKSIRNIVRSVFKNAVEALELADKDVKEIKVKYFVGQDGLFTISVKDNGVGVSDEDKIKIFDVYTTKKKDGSGYGLMLAKYITEKLGGSLSLESSEGKYTTVTIKLGA